jgi:hypothetical protein
MTLDQPLPRQDKSADYVSLKLWREANVFAGGTVTGVSHAITDRPRQELTEFGASFGIGMGITMFCNVSKAAMPTLLKELWATSTTLTVLTDLAPRFDTACEAWKRTWQSSKNLQSDKAEIGQSMGSFIVDNTLTTGAGIFGAKFGSHKIFHRALDVPGLKHVVSPTLSGLEKLEKRISATAAGIRTVRLNIETAKPDKIDICTEQDLALMRARIFGEETALQPEATPLHPFEPASIDEALKSLTAL